MAKSFKTVKKYLDLLDVIPIGKYKDCRVDSIISMDYEYLIFMDKEGILRFSPSVLDALKNKFSAYSIEVRTTRYYADSFDMINGQDMAAVGVWGEE